MSRRRQPGVDVIEPARQAASVAIERATADPGMARPPVPGDDPIVEREPKRRQVLVGGRDGRQPLEDRAEVVAEEADEAAEEWRRIGRDDDRPVEAATSRRATANGSGPAAGDLEDGDRIRREVGPARVAPGPRALEQDEARQVAERLRGIDRARAGDPVGQATEPERARWIGRSGSSRPMIRRVAWQAARRRAVVSAPRGTESLVHARR